MYACRYASGLTPVECGTAQRHTVSSVGQPASSCVGGSGCGSLPRAAYCLGSAASEYCRGRGKEGANMSSVKETATGRILKHLALP